MSAQSQLSFGSQILTQRWLTTSDRLRLSLPTRPWTLGHVCTSYWAEMTFKYHVCAPCVLCVRACDYVCLSVCASFSHTFIRNPNFSSRYSGPTEVCRRGTQKTKLRLTWHLVAEGLNETSDGKLRCDNAVRNGVHLPKAWKSKWRLGTDVLPTDAWAHGRGRRGLCEFAFRNTNPDLCVYVRE